MRKTIFAVLTVLAAGTASLAGSTPAAAYDYPYCLQNRQVGIPGECYYQTYEQCMASASGRSATCAINPRVAFGPLPQRRAPRVYDPR